MPYLLHYEHLFEAFVASENLIGVLEQRRQQASVGAGGAARERLATGVSGEGVRRARMRLEARRAIMIVCELVDDGERIEGGGEIYLRWITSIYSGRFREGPTREVRPLHIHVV